MKRFYILFAVCAAILFSCKQNASDTFSKYLNADALATQSFELNVNRDTTLVTKGKCIIKIPAGSLESDQPNIKLEVKEAFNNRDILLAGLTTMSGDKMLNSGGMLKISPASGYKVNIKKPLETLIPTVNYNADMQVYKGVEKDGKVDWVDPDPLPNDSLQILIKAGKELFNSNCASCHKTDKDFTGPGLVGITKRRSLVWIDRFIHNPAGMNDSYSTLVKDKFKPTIMTAFLTLDNKAIYAILAYIETSGGTKPSDFVKATAGQVGCADSCEKYLNAIQNIDDLKKEGDFNQDFFTLDQNINIPASPRRSADNNPNVSVVPDSPKYVQPKTVRATFYTVNIKSFGWVNVDIMADKNKCDPSELWVDVAGTYDNDPQVLLIIPSVKLLVNGGKADDGKQYAFKETNGMIPLPQNVNCYAIAFCESGGKLFFGKTNFVSSIKQSVNISMTETSKQGMTDQIDALNLDGIQTDIKDSKNVQLQQNQAEAEKWRPKNCDCGIPMLDSSKIVQVQYP